MLTDERIKEIESWVDDFSVMIAPEVVKELLVERKQLVDVVEAAQELVAIPEGEKTYPYLERYLDRYHEWKFGRESE